MRPLVSFLNAALHGIFRPKKNGGNGEAGSGGKNEGGPGAGENSPPEEDRKEKDDSGTGAPSEGDRPSEE